MGIPWGLLLRPQGVLTPHTAHRVVVGPTLQTLPPLAPHKLKQSLAWAWAGHKSTELKQPPTHPKLKYLSQLLQPQSSQKWLFPQQRRIELVLKKHLSNPNFSCSDWGQPPAIGPNKPQAIVNPTQVHFFPLLYGEELLKSPFSQLFLSDLKVLYNFPGI